MPISAGRDMSQIRQDQTPGAAGVSVLPAMTMARIKEHQKTRGAPWRGEGGESGMQVVQSAFLRVRSGR
jgi:hypothetical protein